MGLMKVMAAVVGVVLICAVGSVRAQATTQPAPKAMRAVPTPMVPGSLEYRAAQAIGAGDYASALPLLRRLEETHQDDPRKMQAIGEQIRVAEKALNSGYAMGTLPPEERKPIPAPVDGKIADFENIRDLGNFEYDPENGGGIPLDVQAMSEHVIRIRGYMIPMDQAENITTFALVPSLFACCFGQPPQIQHTIVVRTPKGKAVGYYPDEIIVEGKLKVEEKKEDGFVISVFEMSANSVKPMGQ